MSLTYWLCAQDKKLLTPTLNQDLKVYGSFVGSLVEDDILVGQIEQTGAISGLMDEFVLGKVRFWKHKGASHRTPFVRIDNMERVYNQGLILTPLNKTDIRFHRHHKTIDETTPLNRIELLATQDSDFVKRVFTTYYTDVLVPKPTKFEEHFFLYCDTIHLYKGKVR